MACETKNFANGEPWVFWADGAQRMCMKHRANHSGGVGQDGDIYGYANLFYMGDIRSICVILIRLKQIISDAIARTDRRS